MMVNAGYFPQICCQFGYLCISCLAGPPHKAYLGVKTRTPATNAKKPAKSAGKLMVTRKTEKTHTRKWIHFTQDPQQIQCRPKIVLERSGKALTRAAQILKGLAWVEMRSAFVAGQSYPTILNKLVYEPPFSTVRAYHDPKWTPPFLKWWLTSRVYVPFGPQQPILSHKNMGEITPEMKVVGFHGICLYVYRYIYSTFCFPKQKHKSKLKIDTRDLLALRHLENRKRGLCPWFKCFAIYQTFTKGP